MLGSPDGLGERRRHCGSAISALCSNCWKLVICVHYKMPFGYPVPNGAPILGQRRKTKSGPSTEGRILCPQLTWWGPRVCVILGKWPNLSELQIPIGHTPVAPRSRFREGADNLPDPRLQGSLPECPESEHEDSPPEMLRMAALGSEPQKPIW